jgi:hypothetical protein
VNLRNPFQQLACDAPCSQREPRDERDPISLAIVDDIVLFAIGETVAVLHRHDRHDFPRALDMFHCDIG